MKKFSLLVFCVLLVLFGCDLLNSDEDSDASTSTAEQGVESGVEQYPELEAGAYAQEYWGEWIRMDTGDVWRITSTKAMYTRAGTSETVRANTGITLHKQTERVIEASEGEQKYYLYASRTATGRFTGTIAHDVDGSFNILPAYSANAIGSPLFSFGAAAGVQVSARNLIDGAVTETTTDVDGTFTMDSIIPGDKYELTVGEQTVVVHPHTDESDIGTVTITSGVNLKTSITPQNGNLDMALLYAKRSTHDTERTYRFNIDVQNISDETCLVAVFSLSADDGLNILEQPSNLILGTIAPGAKKTIPITVSCEAPEAAQVLKKIYVTIEGADKLWNDAVSLRFHKKEITYYFASLLPTQGMVLAPDAKTYHFKAEVFSAFIGVYRASLTMPWSTKDYLVVFSGAAPHTETVYFFNVNAVPNTDYVNNIDFAQAHEGINNRETGAVRINLSASASGYLHDGDIDYYNVHLGETVPESGAGEGFFNNAPANLSAAGTENGILLSWTDVYGVDSYKVYRSNWDADVLDDYAWNLLGTVNASSLIYSDTSVNYGTVYYYKVAAVSAAGIEGSFSSRAHAQRTPPPSPANWRVETVSAFSTLVNWDAVSGASSYYIYRSTSLDGYYAQIANVSGTSYTDTNLTADTAYYYKIRAYTSSNNGGYSEYSEAVSAVTSILAVRLYKGATFAVAVKTGSYTFDSALSYISNNTVNGDNYFIVLYEDILCAPKTLSYSGRTAGITLMTDGTERTVQLTSSGSLFTIGSGVTLTLQNNVLLKGRSDNNVSLIKIDSFGMFIMNGGKITSNKASNGGGVYVNGGTFTMNNGEISANIISSYSGGGGGGVYVYNNGTFIMYDGIISSNTVSGGSSTSGGGVCVKGDGIFTMNGGTISGNTVTTTSSYSSNYGGGVYVGDDGTFTMSGGTVSGNTVYFSNAYNNDYYSYGGGVYVGGNGTFTKSSTGGVITGYGDNTTTGNKVVFNDIEQSDCGHAVYVSSSKRLENTVPINKALDSRLNGEAGGWTE